MRPYEFSERDVVVFLAVGRRGFDFFGRGLREVNAARVPELLREPMPGLDLLPAKGWPDLGLEHGVGSGGLVELQLDGIAEQGKVLAAQFADEGSRMTGPASWMWTWPRQ